MDTLINHIIGAINSSVTVGSVTMPAFAVRFAALFAAAAVAHLCVSRLVLPLVVSFVKGTKTAVDDAFLKRKFFHRLIHLLPASIIATGLRFMEGGDVPEAVTLAVSKALGLYYIVIVLAIYESVLNVLRDIYEARAQTKKVGITGAIQALKMTGVIVAVILAVSLFAGKSPIYFLSGLGAFTAILMLIFKDPILGLVAGVQLSAMDLVRKGDWIEIPKHGADGHVEEITLTTVTVRNFDKTITAIPAYELVAFSFKNWRGMSESGGRRIKRSLRFSARSIRFLEGEEIERLRGIKLITEYIDKKRDEICDFNDATFSSSDLCLQTNGRRLTNIGTYRAYCDAYLRSHPGINQDMIIMVRQLQSTELGLPLEIYAFTKDVLWIPHENTQSDIFDHFFAIVPEFGLEIYQR